ncbi:MAG: RagB/SusD family nutrient uptake outer membrane protein, partial [Bacteroidetes bacterium]|nr:RagB/SusD family nutrient uptake outer membrane protein [Bacteroidota bacterium]
TTVHNAIPYLNRGDKKYMATTSMAYALLTKMYLNSEVYTGTPRWQEAMISCDSLLANSSYTMEANLLGPFLTNNENSSEIIFSIPYDENTFQGFRIHMRTLHYQMNEKYDMTAGPWNGFAVVPDFFDTYQATDKRRTGYHLFGLQYSSKGGIIIDGTTHQNLNIDPHLKHLKMDASNATPFELRCTGARVGKYEIKKGAKENLSNDFPLFRITDFQLIKAELLIRTGNTGEAAAKINPIRSRAGIGAFDGGSNPLDSLLAERGRELYCEGVRRQDLIRFGKFKNPKWEKTATDGNDRLTFPIPKWATDANDNLLLDPVK